MKNSINSIQVNLSNEAASQVLSENGFEGVAVSIYAMGHNFKGHGHRNLWAEFYNEGNSLTLTRTTTNMQLTDAWGDDDQTVEGACYESQEEVMKTALDYIISSEYNSELLEEFLNPEEEE